MNVRSADNQLRLAIVSLAEMMFGGKRASGCGNGLAARAAKFPSAQAPTPYGSKSSNSVVVETSETARHFRTGGQKPKRGGYEMPKLCRVASARESR